ncbi:MAG: TetR/AcrR family transcriptional regulator [Proteobacteria bacterium]|nr:TetR/AcrR family transcriptional regulator [Pseudomonadota bacterium]
MPPPQLSSVAPPKQARSEQTLQRILAAAEALIEEKGVADLSIPEIVARAGSSVGGFYARFKDKTALLRALEERFFRQLIDLLERVADPDAWPGASVQQIVAGLVHELVSLTRTRHNMLTAFLTRAAQDPEFRAEALGFRRQVSERVTELVVGRGERFTHPDPALAVDLSVQFAFGLMLQNTIYGETRAAGRTLGDAELVREISRNVLAYAGVESASDLASSAPSPRRDP